MELGLISSVSILYMLSVEYRSSMAFFKSSKSWSFGLEIEMEAHINPTEGTRNKSQAGNFRAKFIVADIKSIFISLIM